MGACTLAMSQVVRSQPACRLRQFTDPSSPQASSVLAETRTTPPDTPTTMTEERREMVRAAIRSASKKGARMALSEEEVERVITACEPAEYSAGQVRSRLSTCADASRESRRSRWWSHKVLHGHTSASYLMELFKCLGLAKAY